MSVKHWFRIAIAAALSGACTNSGFAVVTKHFSFSPRQGNIGGGASVVVPVPKPIADAHDQAKQQKKVKELSLIGKVTKVVDAGTLEVTPTGGSKHTVTLDKISAPKGTEACATTAKDALEKLLKDKKVTVKYTVKDQQGNVTGVVWLGKVNVNLSLVRSGYARSTDTEYNDAERQARQSKLGIWGASK